MAPRIGVVVFPGSNCEHDVVQGGRGRRRPPGSCSGTATPTWPAVDAVVLPGGFAHGDYLRPGRAGPLLARDGGRARLRPRRRARRRHLQRLPGPDRGGPAAGRAAEERAPPLPLPAGARWRSTSTASVLTAGATVGEELVIPINHFSGNYTCDDETLRRLQAEGRIVLRYADNPNGSVDAIAGIANEAGNVVGLMPHPERASTRCWAPRTGSCCCVRSSGPPRPAPPPESRPTRPEAPPPAAPRSVG